MGLHSVKMYVARTVYREIEIDERAGPTHAKKDTHDVLSASLPPDNLRDDVSTFFCKLGNSSLAVHRRKSLC